MNEAELIELQDKERVRRAFVNYLGAKLGVEQTMIGEDGRPASNGGGYWSVNPQSGASSRQANPQAKFVITENQLLIGGLIIFAWLGWKTIK